MTAANPDIRARLAASDLPFVVLALVSGAVLLYLGRSLTFWHDEWRSVTFSGSAIDYLQPVNEHWSTIPLLLYRATFRLVGLDSYLPYLAEVVVLHLVAVAAAYVLVRRRAGRLVATASSIPLLLLGTGSENLFWAFQTGFVGSVAFGLWAVVLLERGSRLSSVAASLLLLASLMSSGVGLVFLVVAAGRTIFDAAIRIRGLAVIPPGVTYLIWHALAGNDAVDEAGHVAGVEEVVRFVVRGVAHAMGAFTGLEQLPGGEVFAAWIFVVLLVATGWAVLKKGTAALAAGCLLGVVAIYMLAGSVRAHLEFDYATVSRYVYVAGFLLVLAIADWLPELRSWLASRRSAWRPVAAVLAVALAASVWVNLDAFADVRAEFQYNADVTRAYVDLAQAHGGEAWVDRDAQFGVMPRVPELLETLERHGSPLRDRLVGSVVRRPGAEAYEAALLRLVGHGFRVGMGPRRGELVPIRVVESRELVVAPRPGCVRLTHAGPNAAVVVSEPGGTWLHVTASSTVRGSVALGHELPPSRRIPLDMKAPRPAAIRIPDVGDGVRWQVRLDLPGAMGRIGLCASRQRQAALG